MNQRHDLNRPPGESLADAFPPALRAGAYSHTGAVAV